MVDNMTGVIMNPFKLDQQAVFPFLTVEGCRQTNIHQRMMAVYSEKCISQTTVKDWALMFLEGQHLMNIFCRQVKPRCWDIRSHRHDGHSNRGWPSPELVFTSRWILCVIQDSSNGDVEETEVLEVVFSVATMVVDWSLNEQLKPFFSDGIRHLPKQWDTWQNAYGDYSWQLKMHASFPNYFT